MADKRVGEACTRSTQCERGLLCARGACRGLPPDASLQDAEVGDDAGKEFDRGK